MPARPARARHRGQIRAEAVRGCRKKSRKLLQRNALPGGARGRWRALSHTCRNAMLREEGSHHEASEMVSDRGRSLGRGQEVVCRRGLGNLRRANQSLGRGTIRRSKCARLGKDRPPGNTETQSIAHSGVATVTSTTIITESGSNPAEETIGK